MTELPPRDNAPHHPAPEVVYQGGFRATVSSLLFNIVALVVVAVLVRKSHFKYRAYTANLQDQFRKQLDHVREQVNDQVRTTEAGSLKREVDVLKAEILALRRGLYRNNEQRGELEKATLEITQLWSELYRLQSDTSSSAAIGGYSSGISSAAANNSGNSSSNSNNNNNNSSSISISSSASQIQLGMRRSLGPKSSTHDQSSGDSSYSGNSFLTMAKSLRPHISSITIDMLTRSKRS